MLKISRFYELLGLIHSKYDETSQKFVQSPRLKLYSVVLTIIIQTLNGVSYYYRLPYMKFKFLTSTSFLNRILLINNAYIFIAMNTFIMFRIIFTSARFTKLFNQLELNKRSYSNDLLHKVFGIALIIGNPIGISIYYGMTKIACFTIISHYLLMSQFVAGHLYEHVLVENVINNFKDIQCKFESNISENSFKKLFKKQFECVKLAKNVTKLFEWNKAVGLTAVWILVAFYCFYGYENLIIGSFEKNVYLIFFSNRK